MKFRSSKLIILAAMLAALTFTASTARAAILQIIPEKDTFSIGDQIIANIKIDSEGVGINAAQATFQYPKDILEITGTEKTGSIFDFWLRDPEFSNDTGRLVFTGGSTSGFSGKTLQVLKIVFKVKGAGPGEMTFVDGAVTASDGSGTNVLSTLRGAQIQSISKAELPPAPVPPPVQITRPAAPAQKLPSKPEPEVPLYSDPQKWYNISSVFSVRWPLPPDIIAVATAIDKTPSAEPTKSEGLFDNKIFPALENGVWYLHIQFKNNIGWGPVTHWRIGIDTTPPSAFQISVAEGLSTDTPDPSLTFQSSDALSGIDHYELRIGDGDLVTISESKHTLAVQAPGKHLVKVSAVDKAGNRTENSVEINILPIESPVITSVTRDVFVGEGGLFVSGTSLPGATIILSLENRQGHIIYQAMPIADAKGNWQGRFDQPLKRGTYIIEAVAKDSRGALSLPVKSDVITVREKPLFTLGGVGITQLWFFVGLIAILLIGFAVGWFAYMLWLRQLGRKLTIAERDVVNAFNVIKTDLEKISKALSVKKVTDKEVNEVKFVLKHTNAETDKLRKYIIENLEEIND